MAKSKNILQTLMKPFKFHSSKDVNKEGDLEKLAAQEQKIFSYEAIVSATKDFHPNNKLGEGGFGPVYKGKLEDGREVAVKKLSHSSSQGTREFKNEARLLSRVQHRNVVNLLGYCVHGAEKLLVYEYVAHESLDKLLFNSEKRRELDWKKSGYMAPEYVMHGHLSVKADVFSFGVLVLELISGQKNLTFNLQLDAQNLLEWVYKLYKKGRSLDIMDPTLASSAATEQVALCIQIGLLCTQSDPQLRPPMRRVVLLFSKKPGTLEEPTRPGVPGSRYRRTRRHRGSSSNAGTSGQLSHTFETTSANTSATASSSASAVATPMSDPHGSSATASSSTSVIATPKSDPHGKRPMIG
ncbi:Serine-threonine/tyrosine-protein kinase, catalytic domain [Dillenia turbinata]|uniref:Serine-threonine/tyrosine-protein kinase, catalytic domain n=1 Tax=Dillenia turbinata TaxID=194707 RepID=A0AAN8UTP5_9MAGN